VSGSPSSSFESKANRGSCRSCGQPLTDVLVDLGLSPISNAFIRPERASLSEKFYPLKTYVCGACWLVQLEDYEAPDTHFHGNYMYFSSFSDTWLAHARGFVERATKRLSLGPHSRVVEVASNDGYLLQYFVERGIPCLGVDPAMNCAVTAWHERRVQTEVAFFGSDTASRLLAQGGAADLIVANNVLAHVPNINDFVAGFKILLKPGGIVTFEFPHILEMIRNSQFDTIYHEHYSYLSYVALAPLFARHGLSIVDVDRLQTHGGSLRLYVRHSEPQQQPSVSVRQLESEELSAGLDRAEPYRTFGADVRALKRSLLTLLIGLINDGKRIAGYGAPAKGNTLLNYCGIGTDFLAFTVDRNIYKQGLLLPGTHIPIRSPEAIFSERPDYVLILPWNLRDEIVAQLAGIRDWGGKFIVPIPHPIVLD
jgi:SAM-dependent methyltransferase